MKNKLDVIPLITFITITIISLTALLTSIIIHTVTYRVIEETHSKLIESTDTTNIIIINETK